MILNNKKTSLRFLYKGVTQAEFMMGLIIIKVSSEALSRLIE